MKLLYIASRKLILGIFLSLLTSSVFAAGQQCNTYHIQLIVTSSASKADGMQPAYNQAGFNTSVVPFVSNSKTLYRLRTGPYSTLETAKQSHQTMKSQLRGNATAQKSIITKSPTQCGYTAPSPTQQNTAYLKNSTQCYRNNDPKIVIAIQLTEQNGKINGYYFSRPTGVDGAYGFIKGSIANNLVKAKSTYTVEGYTGTDVTSYRIEKQSMFDVGNANYRYQKVSCAGVKSEIDVAKDVSKALQSDGQQPTSNTNRTSLRFADYQAVPYQGKNRTLVMDEFGRSYRTRLSDAIKNQKPAFAGHYLVTGWGCGSGGCNTGAVINAKTGVATPFPVSISSAPQDRQEHIYNLNSRLMIFAGYLEGSEHSDGPAVEFYEFKNGKFIFLETRPY